MSKQTGKRAASRASATLRSGATGRKSKSASGSALSQRKAPKKETRPKAARNASATLRSRSTGGKSKSAAGSALSQTPRRRRKSS